MGTTANLLLRIGVAFAFLYPPVNALFDPTSWIAYFPHMVRGFVPDPVLLHAFGIVEVLIALWILSGKKAYYPAALATLLLVAIVVFDSGDFQILFRDVAIALGAAALAVDSYMKEKRLTPVL